MWQLRARLQGKPVPISVNSMTWSVVLVADRGLLSVSNIEELAKLQTQLKKDGRDVALEYILAARVRQFAPTNHRSFQ